ncbi:uncharacterized protein N7529_006076 [Penicillium soppii]|jgi:hypothetical protein|uniref:uncharacterized protein n=1 Tax=Penicillium soppii TaxID=69789 RepID=UPI002549BB56|nr:uncharacterized protein N7529_006076 [Penicillium soppii]KAJ5864160.1 hypothetical protein N7529_006076 [Penicillium soppii]
MTRTVYLISARYSSSQRAHFSIFVPLAADSSVGTKIHVTGAPMVGYNPEFKRNYNPSLEKIDKIYPIGEVPPCHIVDFLGDTPSVDSMP